jgi:heme exporter protein D
VADRRIGRTGGHKGRPYKYMNLPSLSEFWRACVQFFGMGGYAFYVWGSYGVTLVLLGGEVLMLFKRKRNLAKRESSPRD